MANSHLFATVKAYSKKGKLLSKNDLQTFAESRDLEELITRIRNTNYSQAMEGLDKTPNSEQIEYALQSHLADIHYSIAKTSDSKVLDAYFMKFIIRNLKLILKGRVLQKSQQEIESRVNLHAEELIRQRDVVVKALVAKDLEETVSSLSDTIFGKDVAKAAALYQENNNIQIFDTYFDKTIISHLATSLRNSADRDMTRLVGIDIDFYNLLSILRGKFWELDTTQIQDLIISQTSRVSKDLLGRMINSNSVKEAFDELSASSYKGIIPETENEIDAISAFERSMDLLAYKEASASFTRMFSLGTSIGITKLTNYEIRNISAIGFAVEHGIPTETTMAKIIVNE